MKKLKCKCGSSDFESAGCNDNPYPAKGKPYAYNIYFCEDCGMVIVNRVWNNSNVFIPTTGDPFVELIDPLK